MSDGSAKVRTFLYCAHSRASRFDMTTPNTDPLHGVTLEQILTLSLIHK